MNIEQKFNFSPNLVYDCDFVLLKNSKMLLSWAVINTYKFKVSAKAKLINIENSK